MLLYVRVLSLDIVAGACICSLFFAEILEVEVGPPTLICLGISVWLIYTMDHLLDGLSVRDDAAFRHLFHRNYRRPIFAAWIILAFAGLMISFQLPVRILQAGLILSLLVLIYFFLVYLFRARQLYHKELFGSFIYTAGVFLPVLTVYPAPWPYFMVVLILEFFLLGFINLLLFARMDLGYDKAQSFASLPGSIGQHQFTRILNGLFILTGMLILVGAIWWKSFPNLLYGQFITGVMLSVLGWLHISIKNRQANLQFQLLGDSIFLFPLILLL